MLSLLFPNPDALRLALASGIIPAGVASTEIAAAPGDAGGLWIETKSALDKHPLAALAHIGVRPFTRPVRVPSRSYPCWAAALPLRRAESDSADGPVLFELPAARLAGFLAELARCECAVEAYRFADASALIRVDDAPHYWIERARDGDDPSMRCFRRAAPGFWVEVGWQHTLPPSDAPDDARTILVSATAGWHTLESAAWHSPREVLALPRGPSQNCSSGALVPVRVPIRLKRRAEPAAESFWIVPGTLADLRPLFDSSDPAGILKLSFAQLRSTVAGDCVALLSTENRGGASLAASSRAFAPHPQLKGLMIPAEGEPAPALRPAALASAFALRTSDLVWLEPNPEGVHCNRVPISTFRQLADAIRYTAPDVHRHRAAIAPENPFALSGFIVVPEPVFPAPAAATPAGGTRGAPVRSVAKSARLRFAEWAGKLFAKTEQSRLFEALPEDGERDLSDADAPARIALTRQERIARRAELEEAIFGTEPGGRIADRWAELAELYAEGGNPTDAALCWLHAVWNSPHPPDPWLQQWAKVEARSGKSAPLRRDLADSIRLANHASPHHPAAATELKALLARLEAAEENLPCRLVWLARVAIARLSGGDVLLLARGRDRLFARLQHETALAAQDTPSFLRFRALAGSDRYPRARDWLLRCREPIHRWLMKQGKSNRSAWAGLDADIPSTSAYADLMLAWGFAKLGDRARTSELTAAAHRALQDAAPSGSNTSVPRRLVGLFRREIDTAIRTRTVDGEDEPGVESAMLADYVVAKLVSHSRILGAAENRSEFGAGPLAALLGDDGLGAKLLSLLERRIPPDEAIVRSLLDLVNADRTAATLPRVILALLEVPGSPELVADVLPIGPRALELLPEALRLRGIDEAESAGYLVRLSGRCIGVICRLAVSHADSATLQSLVKTLLRGLDADDAPSREMLRLTASRLFRALSRSGLTAEIRLLLSRWYGVAAERVEANLSAAIGWYTLGEAERGNRILNDARERLFVEGIADERERTRTALAYAQALAHVPPRLALGRLEELFQRLGTISTEGATARYYALKPLELIDAAITAIVNEDFSLGPEVRNWLDEDERRIRGRITRDLGAALKGMDGTW